MPRLGTAAEDEDPETEGRQRRQFPSVGSARPPTSHHHMATAYAYGSSTILHNNNNSPLARLGMLLLIVVLTIILRNVLFHVRFGVLSVVFVCVGTVHREPESMVLRLTRDARWMAGWMHCKSHSFIDWPFAFTICSFLPS